MRREHKTIVLWAVLIVMFVMVYSMFSTGNEHESSEPVWVAYVVIVVGGAALTYIVIRNMRETRRFLREQHDEVMVELANTSDLTPNSMFPAMKMFTRSVIDCRSGRPGEAARLLDENWAMCELSLTGESLRPMRVVRAFATAAADPRDAGKASVLLSNARPTFDGEYDFLGKAWPEMQAFLVTHALATSSVHPT